MVAGVCGGLGRYAERDPLWFRVLFVMATFATAGVGILVYFGLWLAIPLEQPGDGSARQRSGCVLMPT